MRKLFQKQSINQANAISILLVALLTTFVLVFIIYNLHDEHQQEIENIEKEYIENQKELIKIETNRALKYISYKHKKDGATKPLEEIQSDIVDAIEQMRDERDGTGYIFIYTFDGVNIADPILKKNAGKNLIDIEDPNGKRVIYELIEVSKQPEGGYVEYVWNKPLINKLAPKISYAVSYKPWRWMIGAGVYLDDMYDTIKKKKFAYKNRVSKFIIGIMTLASTLFFIGMVIYHYFASTVTKDITYIEESLKNISRDYQKLDLDEIRYSEYRKTSDHINNMVEEIKEKKLALEDLNKNLEHKVEEKTYKLQSAKEFAESLVEAQDKFIKNAIHEINTPLSIIITNLDLYNMQNPKNRYLTKIEAAVKIIHNIYNDLSYAAKKDRIDHPKRLLNFSELLQERVDFFNEVALGSLITLSVDIESDIFINFNDVELQRVLDNNISNAIKYSFKEKSVTVKLYRMKKDMICFEVINFGVPIIQPDKLFERFYREHDSRGGFGIGLHIVKEICDKNGVKVKVLSSSGVTTFRYRFYL
ncbi:MAG: cache domain-containing protein [Epsilonproteobacteria bacterium]|nr:cache domain-containing protein [Campylobacterota bacterium]